VVCLDDGIGQAQVLNPPAVHEEGDVPAVRTMYGCGSDEAPNPDRLVGVPAFIDGQQTGSQIRAVYRGERFVRITCTERTKCLAPIVHDPECHIGVCNRVSSDEAIDVATLGLLAAEELPPGRDIVEQILDDELGAWRSADRSGRGDFATLDPDARSGRLGDMACQAGRSADGGDARQRLAPESQRSDGLQVLRSLELTRGVAPEGKGDLLCWDTDAIIADGDQRGATVARFDLDPRALCVQAVLHQLFDDRRGPLDYLAGGDARRHGFR